MSFSECCKNCKHCVTGRSSAHGWCSLRKIKLHSEIAQFVYCHHWMQREPLLPSIEERHLHIDQQLDFGKALVNSDS